MKQSLQLKLGQQLTMTPQLQQAIRLLQLSSLELQVEIQQALESNLMLEVDEEQEPETKANEESNNSETPEPSAEEKLDATEAAGNSETLPDELPVDSAWEDVYDNSTSYSAPAEDDREFTIQDDSGDSLHDHLNWQMDLTPFTDKDRAIATAIIDSINDDGYLSTALDDIAESFQIEDDVELDEIEAVLHRIQQFDPPGIAARDLRESLLLQMQLLNAETPFLQEARQLVSENLALLGNHDYTQLKRKLKLDEKRLIEVIHLIESLEPRPGSHIASSRAEYIVPDVFVRKQKGVWRVELNSDVMPKVGINNSYAALVRRGDSSADNTYLKNHLQEARWFLKSLMSRNETLLKVATCIVERQRAFLEYGDEAMKPLVLRDVAETVEMHESTISRVTTQKYMHTPRGIFEFKYFFSSQVSTSDGSGASATAIRAMLKKMVADENQAKPLSDSKLAEILTEQGINVARRTVAKYREALSIPPSNERKRLA
ncbi:RNA polymerase factor sigma-54 [Solemya pervernicosa gill symbiont]|uniref:RNA polymerase sigma-54 factor n=2 Tax=Gammaproteobacteria incertae sedis TaxID=118884 RepID=A0A1T2L6Z5_9GAMM|nr:RNA polymerase factor sigma-54 [Candidatus Reidiella endopervernicosa]OOZ40877.1 RNA polymerase factor sigma-54 [Solemya pervernicosa gill symbiont]QKQ26155.1 RNA polymerase factor sigma-54 [Candidatus Reidiella endopervernicosa]